MMMQMAVALLVLTLASGLWPLLLRQQPRLQRGGSCLLLGLSGVGSVVVGLAALAEPQPWTLQLPLGLPWLHWHLRLDALSGFFLLLLGIVTSAVAIYSLGYCRAYDHKPLERALLPLFTALFVAAMQLVLLADDAFVFMIAWELMSLASYLLVAFRHEQGATRRAAFLYLLMAHIGGLAILLAFGVLAGFGASFTFDDMRSAALSSPWATLAFALAFFGFGTKAGLVPMHAWLPAAHPVAPSHISALLSAVIVKVALYGFIRVTFDLLGDPPWQWGLAVLTVGALTALYGVLYALLQSDLKRLLAYSTVENIGVIFIGLGLAIVFLGNDLPRLGALAFIAALYHALNHACFKGLLFLGAGAVLHNTHSSDLNQLGGLIGRMPWSAFLFLFGCLSIAALPPFNGFVSEWLTFQSLLQVGALESGVMRASIPLVAASLALTAALAAACFVKAYGIAFLGRARSSAAAGAHEVCRSMLLGKGLLAALCLLLGVMPTWVVGQLSRLTSQLLGQGLPSATAHGWLWLTPVAPERASYSAPLVFVGILLALLAWLTVYLTLRRRRRIKPVARVAPWDCGFGPLSPRMQYSAESFAMPFQRLFEPLFALQETLEPADPLAGGPRYRAYRLEIHDLAARWLYRPLGQGVLTAARHIGRIQTGHLRHYLSYSLITLVLLLWMLR